MSRSRAPMYLKMAGVGGIFTLGGPLLMYYVTPSEGELFARFNPELQARNLANRDRRLREQDVFLSKLREYSKSDKPIWEVAREREDEDRQRLRNAQVGATAGGGGGAVGR